MKIDWSVVFGIGMLICSLLTIYFAFKKQRHEETNLDADTINKYIDSINKAQENYDKLEKRFTALQSDFAIIKRKVYEYECWNKALTEQIIKADMVPISLEQAIKGCK